MRTLDDLTGLAFVSQAWHLRSQLRLPPPPPQPAPRHLFLLYFAAACRLDIDHRLPRLELGSRRVAVLREAVALKSRFQLDAEHDSETALALVESLAPWDPSEGKAELLPFLGRPWEPGVRCSLGLLLVSMAVVAGH